MGIEIALVYPNRPDVGMASLGYRIVHALMNSREDVSCERAFPAAAGNDDPPRTLESRRTLDDFDCVAFSISYENDFPRLIAALASAGIHPLRRERDPGSPLVIAGGSLAMLNPEPLSPVVDLFLIGEGEILIPEFLDVLAHRAGRGKEWKAELTEALSDKDGFYVPPYGPGEKPHRVRRVFIPKSARFEWGKHQAIYPDSHLGNVYLLEVGRGCARRCRFCAARSIYHPTRFRSSASLEEEIRAIPESAASVGFLGASLSDFPRMAGLVAGVRMSRLSVQTSSLRMDRLEPVLLGELKTHGVRTISTAPEAGSERMRRVIGKDLTEEEILDSAVRIGKTDFPRLKLYFMIGLPGERHEDVVAIADLSRMIAEKIAGTGAHTRITVSLSPFVPKPWTPFQWAPFEKPARLRTKINAVRKAIRGKVAVKAESVRASEYQALLARGDWCIGEALAVAVREGRSPSACIKEAGLSKSEYLYRERGEEEDFPWDFIDHGLKKEKLWSEWEKSREEASR